MKAPVLIPVLVITVLLVSLGCSNKFPTTPSPTPYFVQQKEIPNAYMRALLIGKLVLVDGCLRVDSDDGDSYLVIWPQGFSLRANDKAIEIVDKNGQLVAREGDNLKIGGGELSHIAEYVLQPLPDNCPGPYWVVGNEITR